MLSAQALGLGLGEAQVDSALGQPLEARIPIVKTAAERLSPDSVVIRLASASEHARAGLTYPASLADAFVELKRPTNARPYVSLTTTDGVVEPLLTLLIEFTWPGGQIFEEVVLLLDPPVVRQAEAATPQPAQPRADKREAIRAAYDSTNRVYGPVAAGQTLSEIAQALRPRGVPLDLHMQAIFESNPQAFGDSMNLLHKGAMLGIPEPAGPDDTAEPATTGAAPSVVETPPESTAEVTPVEEQAPSQESTASGGRLYVLGDDEQSAVTTGEPESPEIALPTVANDELEQEIAVLQNRLRNAEMELEEERLKSEQIQSLVARMRDELTDTRIRLEQAIVDYQRLAEEQSKGPAAPVEVADTETEPMTAADWLEALPTWLVWGAGLFGFGLLGGLLIILMLRRREDRYWEQRRQMPVSDEARHPGDGPDTTQAEIEPLTESEIAPDYATEQGGADEPPELGQQDDDTRAGAPPVTASIDDDLHTKYEKVSSMAVAGAGEKQIVEYLTTGQYNLADTEVHHEIIGAEGNDEGKLLLLTFYKAIGRHDELKQLAQAILDRCPDPDDPTRKEVLAICHNVVKLEGSD
ncbi:MAG: hypothetical protein ACR2RB_04185, partial [Gammaproteobacteria bacterium]